jgi:hypothetical protein
MTLDDAIATLYAREINCGCETFWDGGIKVWIGDTMNGHHAETQPREHASGRALAGRGGDTALSEGVSVAPASASVARPPGWAVNTPRRGLPAPRAPEAVVALAVHH